MTEDLARPEDLAEIQNNESIEEASSISEPLFVEQDATDLYATIPLKREIDNLLQGLVSAQSIMDTELPPMEWVVEGLLPVGFALLGGTPKAGKSLFALDLAIAVSSGKPFLADWPVKQGKVLYITYEDTFRRLQKRLREKHGQGEHVDLSNIHFHLKWPSMNHGGLNLFKPMVEALGDVRLIVVDTLACFQGMGVKQGYTAQYEVIAEMSRIANDLGVAMIALHHTTKLKAAKWKQAFYGSNGVTGGADTLMLLDRDEEGAGATLRAAGRDIEERALRLMMEGAAWKIGEVEMSEDMKLLGKEGQAAVYRVLREVGTPLSLKELAERTEKSKANVANMLKELVAQGMVVKHEQGSRPTYSVERGATDAEQ